MSSFITIGNNPPDAVIPSLNLSPFYTIKDGSSKTDKIVYFSMLAVLITSVVLVIIT
tara:strand:- start:125 stop:295 length:171 start_codon:yes stop_codon:yes gene_type:complete